jgi:hypothetical protein
MKQWMREIVMKLVVGESSILSDSVDDRDRAMPGSLVERAAL